MIILLPWPSPALSPNAGSPGKWRRKSTAANIYKWQCAEALQKQELQNWSGRKPHVLVIFFPPPRADGYDIDNALARLKQGLDVVAQKIKCDDKHWFSMEQKRGETITDGVIILVFSEPKNTDLVKFDEYPHTFPVALR